MNREHKKNLQKVARRVAKLEKQRIKGENVESQIEQIWGELNIEEMLYVDDYIISKKLLTN